MATNQASYTPGVLSQTAKVGVVAPADADHDGLPDAYETAHGLDPSNALDAGQDADVDGVSNRDEFVAGTDPGYPASFLRVDIVAGTTEARIRFNAVENKTYTVQYRDQVAEGPWVSLGGVAAISSTSVEKRWVEIVDRGAPAQSQRFYRLVTPGVTAE